MRNIYRFIVGPEYGFTGEGNEQWFYTLSLAINLMLVWWLKPEIALLFSVLSAIHYVTVFVYGYFDLTEKGKDYAATYFGIHAILAIIAIVADYKWAIITAIITVVAYFIAPDCTGNNIFLRGNGLERGFPLIFNTIIMAAFIIIDLLLPIKLWVKILIIAMTLIIHPIIDYFEGECVIISDVTYEVWENIKVTKKNKR